MKTLVVGAGALGGIIGARLLSGGASVSLATRDATAAEEIKASGLRVIGIGGELSTEAGEVAPLAEYSVPGTFDLIVLATKGQDAINVAASLVRLLAPRGTLLPIQNGGVPQMLASQLGDSPSPRARSTGSPARFLSPAARGLPARSALTPPTPASRRLCPPYSCGNYAAG
jgi:2-dehydropantoate 2-reductase